MVKLNKVNRTWKNFVDAVYTAPETMKATYEAYVKACDLAGVDLSDMSYNDLVFCALGDSYQVEQMPGR